VPHGPNFFMTSQFVNLCLLPQDSSYSLANLTIIILDTSKKTQN